MHIFGFIIVPSYALKYSHKLPFEGGVNSKNMISQLSYIPELLLYKNDKSVCTLKIKNCYISDDYENFRDSDGDFD